MMLGDRGGVAQGLHRSTKFKRQASLPRGVNRWQWPLRCIRKSLCGMSWHRVGSKAPACVPQSPALASPSLTTTTTITTTTTPFFFISVPFLSPPPSTFDHPCVGCHPHALHKERAIHNAPSFSSAVSLPSLPLPTFSSKRASAQGKRKMCEAAGRQRHRNANIDESGSDDEPPQQQTVTTVQDTTAAAPPARVRAKAPAAAVVSAPSLPLHVDPTATQVTAPAAVSPEAADSEGRSNEDAPFSAAAAVPSNELSEEMNAIDYDTLTYAALLDLMKRASRSVIEEMMAQREQHIESSVEQQQNQRVERFLDVATTSSATAAEANGSNVEDEAAEGYRYNTMLTRLFEALNRNNEGSAMTERNQLPVPILERIGKKKTVITNFGRICDAFHRPMEDVKDFIEKELSIRGNLDSNNALILKLEIRKQTDFDRMLIKYLDEYVKCNSCHRIDTTLTKDGRRLELRCNVCTATRTVTAAGTATFSAQIEKRSRQRAAMTL
ncbi:translation initiation factor-like protein [Leishmania tarentolae]|uniref:Translation initiation factor-like protein n=1 Tax=Leishmania tarentolae TaxID=5689 RepID=A0A640K914_LEITA|nr:translation initiation factor-like protein [Leishmania tarentolae]